MEPLYKIKFHLKSNYEEFFFTTRDESDEYAYQTIDEKITIINEKNLFNKEFHDDEITDITDKKESKNYALPASMEFRHEKNCHQKFAGKNPGQYSPLIFVKDLRFERISLKLKNGVKGESGWMVESFISVEKEKIKELKTGLIYGDLLDFRLFIQKNFNELFLKMDKIKIESKLGANNIGKSKQTKEKETEKQDKNKEKLDKAKKIKNLLKKYEKIGIMMTGDVIHKKEIRGTITYYDHSGLVHKPESTSKSK